VRIAVVTTSYPAKVGDPSGHFVQAEARSLARAGHDVFVLSPFTHEHETAGLTHIQVAGAPLFGWPGALQRLKAAPWLCFQSLGFAASVQHTLRRLAPLDKIVAHWLVPSAWPAALGHAQLEVVVHGSDVRLLAKLPRVLSTGILSSLLARRATFQCVSEALEHELLLLHSRLAGATSVRPCSIDLDAAPTREQARASLQLGNRQLVLIVGRLVAGKRTSVALNASELLPNVQVVVVGDGPELTRLEKRHPNVLFLGKLSRPQTLAWIAAADVLLSASLHEGAPTSVREAIALHVNVIACPSGDLQKWALNEPLLWVTRERLKPADPRRS
jgi:phosphatidylinositol alpha 1,6-mannosyltransferase